MQHDALTVARAYHRAWTTRNFEDAGRHLADALLVEVPINQYPTKAEFLSAVKLTSQMATQERSRRCFGQQFTQNALVDGVAYLTVDLELLLLRTSSLTRVWEAPLQTLSGTEEHRARPVSLIADGDHRVERFVDIALESLTLLVGDVDAEFGHAADR